MARSDSARCIHCDATQSEDEIRDGWCGSCGKRLPSWVAAGGKRDGGTGASSPAGGSPPTGPRILWAVWGIVFAFLFGLAALIVS